MNGPLSAFQTLMSFNQQCAADASISTGLKPTSLKWPAYGLAGNSNATPSSPTSTTDGWKGRIFGCHCGRSSNRSPRSNATCCTLDRQNAEHLAAFEVVQAGGIAGLPSIEIVHQRLFAIILESDYDLVASFEEGLFQPDMAVPPVDRAENADCMAGVGFLPADGD